ncbi:Hsp70 family protein [Glycomyces sp. TRM65418]|uniref:Hsp70 family protein n=1 Tax=Glycomyces sp. TRM65418 TaxID=2867006 RepID=UPI001CE539F6|nr:Hsp70 family protein [Glycomyces sp. TRM65418]MCC3764910.1 Hsp70 family protein [Glycomyces sp. TRM65418]QZD54551.1 Hsp70 family protein [Glycomyces sp. TRM65418]
MTAARIDPEAAAARLTEATGRPLEPDAAFAVYRLGRSAFQAAVVRRFGHAHVIVAERSAAIGGAEFDGLLLAYLSGRHPDAGVRLWARIDDPADPADRKLRELLLQKITQAREALSDRDFTVMTLPAADVKLPLTREELESRIEELVEGTASLLEEALGEAMVAPGALAGVLMAGGAARTPLVAATLRRRLGVEPVTAAAGGVLAVEQPPAETRELDMVEEEPAARRRGGRRALAVVAALAVVVAAGAAFGTRWGDEEASQGGVGGAESAPAAAVEPEPTTATASPSTSPSEPSEGPETAASPSPAPADDEPEEPSRDEVTEEAERPTSERPATGAVPDLIGLSTADARRAVEEAGFADVEETGKWRSALDFTYDDCEVIEQDPAAGTTRPLSETVAVTFSYNGDASECEE